MIDSEIEEIWKDPSSLTLKVWCITCNRMLNHSHELLDCKCSVHKCVEKE